jgi:hypothetical protein
VNAATKESAKIFARDTSELLRCIELNVIELGSFRCVGLLAENVARRTDTKPPRRRAVMNWRRLSSSMSPGTRRASLAHAQDVLERSESAGQACAFPIQDRRQDGRARLSGGRKRG